MRIPRLHPLLLATLAGLLAGGPASVHADDTEIYLGSQSLGQGVVPNVLFILDTSGSMSELVSGTGKDRLDNMKDALYQILDDTNNINVGLMRFTDPGGPVLFPVSYIDEDVSVVEAAGQIGLDVVSRVDASADDAEQMVSTGSVDLVGTQLDLGGVTAVDSVATLDRQVSSQANNAEQQVWDGDIITQSQIDMNSGQTNGVRFENISIPPGAVILDARIEFTARSYDSSNTLLTFYGHADPSPAAFVTACTSCSDVSNRPKTSASVEWNPGTWSSGNRYQTPDLSAIVQELVNQPGWASGNPMAFVQTNGGYGQRRAYTYLGSSANAARLSVSYAASQTTSNQIVGLRFRNIGVPQGATVTNAVLEFAPAATGSLATSLSVRAEASDDAPAFAATANNLSARATTSASVPWTVPAWDDVNVLQQSPSLTSVVQEVVNRAGWCGNNAMALLLEVAGDAGPRLAEAFDGDPSRAPTLRIDYDEDSAPADACINQAVQRQIVDSADDAEQYLSTGYISTSGSQFDMNASQLDGLRFQDLPIAQGQTILEARLTFTSRRSDTGAATVRLWGEDADDAAPFSAAQNDISSRTKTTASVDWSPDDWTSARQQDVTVDLSSLVQEIVNRPGWAPGNSLVILQQTISGSTRRAYSFDGDPSAAPVLQIRVQGALSTPGSGFKSVRTRLKEIVGELDHNGFTPIVDTLYEAARYYRGEGVHWGRTRGDDSTNSTVRRNTRVSHPASYTGGTVVREPLCTDENLSSGACVSEAITGSPVYQSPITSECQANYIVLLTDGEANHNHSETLIRTMTNKTACLTANADERCGRDLTEFLRNTDQSALSGNQSVVTYTIGFNFSTQFLRDLAALGGGQFHTANTANELANVFKAIIADILARTTSFAAPSLSVNAFNKLFHRNEVYFSLFKPDSQLRWDGNVKKYKLCESAADGCVLGEVLDVNDLPAIGSGERIRDDATSFWSAGVDGAEIKVGGAGNEIPAHGTRKVLTYTAAAAPDDVALDVVSHRLQADNALVTKDLLGDPLMSDAERTALINWIRGQDVDDEDADGNSTENRYAFSDPLHSSPVAINYGGTAAEPAIKLLLGTNDGGLRLLNAYNGVEEWIFYPQSMLDVQSSLRANPNGTHVYGLDTTPTVWTVDHDNDGVIEPADGDFVRAYVGMRRGGSFYYAVDLTPGAPVTDRNATTGVSPTLMWRIGPGSEFPRLGQTWSRPVFTQIRVGTAAEGVSEVRNVLVFAGGYDDVQDTGFGTQGVGNAIYIADALTGARLLSVSAQSPGSGDQVVVPEMIYPIPSDVATMDTDADGITDRLYVGDTGGQLWRVDLAPVLTDTPGMSAVVGKLASVSDAVTASNARKFFYPPDVVQVSNTQYSTTARYDMVTIVTGNRAHPLDQTVQDRVYAFRDTHVAPLVDGDGDGLAEGYSTLQDNLYDATGDLLQTATGDALDAQLAAIASATGWYVDFEEPGEKGLASPIVLAGKLFFTTYLPEGVLNSADCSLAEGSGRLYGLDFLSGAAVFNWDETGDSNNLTKSDRVRSVGSGIPSGAVPIFQEEGVTLLIGGGGGATTVDPLVGIPRERTYWFQ